MLIQSKRLTHKQKRFVEEYMITLDPRDAAIKAGFSPKTIDIKAYQLMQTEHVKIELERAINERAKRMEINQDDVLEGLLREARYMGDGTSHSARVAAWAHIAKHLGMFIERISTENGNLVVEIVRYGKNNTPE